MATTLNIYHVKFEDESWKVIGEGNTRPSATEDRKADAVSRAKEIAQNQEPAKVVVYKQDGTVQDEFTYGDVEDAVASTNGEQPKSGALDAGYALAALANDALQLAAEALQLARDLPSKAQARAKDLRDLAKQREQLEQRIQSFRENTEKRVEEKAAEGRTVTEGILSDERVRRVLDQAKTAQSQVKAALTSIRKTGEAAAGAAATAGRQQAETAKSQVKAAATSVKKTGEEARS